PSGIFQSKGPLEDLSENGSLSECFEWESLNWSKLRDKRINTSGISQAVPMSHIFRSPSSKFARQYYFSADTITTRFEVDHLGPQLNNRVKF
ncbi:hypothetical protein NHX12_020447, partial [Muraenolepis orangiensis]